MFAKLFDRSVGTGFSTVLYRVGSDLKRAIAIVLMWLMIALVFPLQPVLAEEELITLEETEPVITSVVEASDPELPLLPLESETEEEVTEPVLEEEVPLESDAILQDEAIETVVEEEEEVPEPTVLLSPEQTLILSLENQITELLQPYRDEPIQSIQVNFYRHLLRVEMNDSWYELDTVKQDEIADQLFTQAKQFDLTKLEILNDQGKLIARSPLIGRRMIIVERR